MAVVPTPTLRTLDTPHGQVRVIDTGGTGIPVLLVHSLLVDPDLYAVLTPLLVARGHRCLVPELPLGAHALPMRPDADLSPPGLARLLVEVLDALGVKQAHVLGVDTGGALTQILMARHRDRVGSVVLTACDAYESFPPRTFGPLFAPLRWPGALRLVGWAARAAAVRRLVNLRPLTHRGVDDAMARRWTGPLRQAGVRRDLSAVLKGMDARHTLAAAAANRDFPRPVLVAWGDDDRAFPRSLGERLAADIPGARMVTLPDCGAFAAIDCPDLLADLVDAHLSGAGAVGGQLPSSA
jgi:pimeloyl-ACP methyl ester carboxylesterase